MHRCSALCIHVSLEGSQYNAFRIDLRASRFENEALHVSAASQTRNTMYMYMHAGMRMHFHGLLENDAKYLLLTILSSVDDQNTSKVC